MWRYLAAAVAGLASVAPITLFAREEASMPVYELEDFVVRAWRFEQLVMEVPADATRIGRDAIERSLAVSVPDLLEIEANLYFSNVSGFNNVSMRGFGEGSGLRSLILVDGQPLNPADMGRINWEQVPLDGIESIEVLRGGHNVLYGDKALSGVIKIETRRVGEDRLDLEGRLGSFGTEQSSLSGTIGRELWGLSVGLSREVSDGCRENSASEARNAYLKADRIWANGDTLDLRLATGSVDLTYPGGLSEPDFRSDPRRSGNLGDEGSENRYTSLTGRARGQRDWGSWELLGGIDHNDIEWSFGEGSYGDNAQSGYSLKPRFRFDFGESAVIAGVDLLYDELDFTAYLDAARSLIPSEAELSESRVSPYAFVERELTDRLTVSGGLRHEWIDYRAENRAYVENQLSPTIETNRGPRPNPNFKDPPDLDPANSYDESIREDGFSAEFSVNFRLTESLSLWAGYDRAYRYPVFDERAAYQGFPLAEFIAQDLEAEEGDQFEIGFKWRQGAHEFYGTLYLLQMENEIIFDPSVGREDPDTPGNGLNRNLGGVDRHGADFSYAYSRDAWGLSLALAWVQTEMQVGVDGAGVGQEVPLVPAVVATSQFWFTPWEPLRLRLTHRYVADRYQGGDFANELAKAEAYQLVGASVEYQLNPNCRIFAKADNLFDQRYAESVFSGSYYPGPGRSLQVGLRLNF